MTPAHVSVESGLRWREQSRYCYARRDFLGRPARLAHRSPVDQQLPGIASAQTKDALSAKTSTGRFSQAVKARALLLGERLETRGIEGAGPVATGPLTVSMPSEVLQFCSGMASSCCSPPNPRRQMPFLLHSCHLSWSLYRPRSKRVRS